MPKKKKNDLHIQLDNEAQLVVDKYCTTYGSKRLLVCALLKKFDKDQNGKK